MVVLVGSELGLKRLDSKTAARSTLSLSPQEVLWLFYEKVALCLLHGLSLAMNFLPPQWPFNRWKISTALLLRSLAVS
jgi:hypothetical protein